MNIIVVIPSRGRPAAAREAVEAVRATAVLVTTSVVLAVDEDDPVLAEYRALEFPGAGPEVTLVVVPPDETGDLTKVTNTVSMRIAAEDPDCVIGNLNDDHRARTLGWDREVAAVLTKPGIAYGNDLIHGERLPSAPFMSARICLALGWYALPTCRHMYIDDAWRELGRALNVLHYIPDIVFEHLHESVGKAVWDEGYARGYASVNEDQAAFNEWMMRYLKLDVLVVRRALGG